MAVIRRFTEEQLIAALLVFGGMYLACPDQAIVDHCENALDMLLMAAHEEEFDG